MEAELEDGGQRLPRARRKTAPEDENTQQGDEWRANEPHLRPGKVAGRTALA